MIRRISLFLVPALAVLIGTSGAYAQAGGAGGGAKKGGGAAKPDQAKKAEEHVVVPFFGNENCPIDNKAVNREKFVESDGQRIYVCSDECATAAKKDLKTALSKAYPSATPVTTKGCGTCAKPMEAGKAKEVTFQGKKMQLCCEACVADFKKAPYLFLVKASWADAKDAKNATDPYDGKPIDPALMAVYKAKIVHFSTMKSLKDFEKDPEGGMAKVKS